MSIPKNHIEVLDFVRLLSESDGKLVSPTLYSMDSHGKYIIWNIKIGLWDHKISTYIPIFKNDSIVKDRAETEHWGVLYTTSGRELGKINDSAATYIKEGKNPGKSNYTTPLTQAIIKAKTQYNGKINKGAVLHKNELKLNISFSDLFNLKNRGDEPWRVHLMLLHDVNAANNWKYVKYPIYLQRKLDGTLAAIVAHPKIPGEIDMYTRGGKTILSQNHVMNELKSYLIANPGIHVVGELYKHGLSLQAISGNSRKQLLDNSSSNNRESENLDFYIYDMFDVDRPDLKYLERKAILDKLLPWKKLKYIKNTETEKINDKDTLMQKFHQYTSEGYEGAVIRMADGLYEFGINKDKRSFTTLKLKDRPDAEYPIVGYKSGENGKEANLIIFICAENDAGVKKRTGRLIPLNERKTFSVTPNRPQTWRSNAINLLNTSKKVNLSQIYGKEATISYSILSEDGIPQQCKWIRFRDPSIEKLFEVL